MPGGAKRNTKLKIKMNDKINILIIEDNQTDADLVIYELKKSGLGFIPEIVQTRETYEGALDSFKPDIILADYSLPSFDGVTAFHIKQRTCPDIPFIIVSGTIGEENAVELIKNGVTDYALKDKLFALPPKVTRALKNTEEMKGKRIADEKLRTQYEKLSEIAFLQSHLVRKPIANILGLISLLNIDNPGDPVNSKILSGVEIAAKELDSVIHQIVKKTTEIREMQ